jgi:hypothetical protein
MTSPSRRRHRYGTILIDLEAHRPVDLPDDPLPPRRERTCAGRAPPEPTAPTSLWLDRTLLRPNRAWKSSRRSPVRKGGRDGRPEPGEAPASGAGGHPRCAVGAVGCSQPSRGAFARSRGDAHLTDHRPSASEAAEADRRPLARPLRPRGLDSPNSGHSSSIQVLAGGLHQRPAAGSRAHRSLRATRGATRWPRKHSCRSAHPDRSAGSAAGGSVAGSACAGSASVRAIPELRKSKRHSIRSWPRTPSLPWLRAAIARSPYRRYPRRRRYTPGLLKPTRVVSRPSSFWPMAERDGHRSKPAYPSTGPLDPSKVRSSTEAHQGSVRRAGQSPPAAPTRPAWIQVASQTAAGRGAAGRGAPVHTKVTMSQSSWELQPGIVRSMLEPVQHCSQGYSNVCALRVLEKRPDQVGQEWAGSDRLLAQRLTDESESSHSGGGVSGAAVARAWSSI